MGVLGFGDWQDGVYQDLEVPMQSEKWVPFCL